MTTRIAEATASPPLMKTHRRDEETGRLAVTHYAAQSIFAHTRV